jgi:hypothetical protein
MLNHRIVNIQAKEGQFVKKISIILSGSPKPFPAFKDHIGLKPDLALIFKKAYTNFDEVIPKFSSYLFWTVNQMEKIEDVKNYRKANKLCIEWLDALKELYLWVKKTKEADKIQEIINNYELRVTEMELKNNITIS